MLRPGTFLQDRYEILDSIGSGGMSVVYKARCHKLDRLVAVKVLKEEFRSDVNFVSRFKQEARAAASLSHPNIVNIYDVIDEGDLHYIVMELIEGITLKNYITKKGHLEARESIGIAIQVAQGIAAAHEQGIIHRDIKPQNMIISKDGKVKVADFGIARAVSSQTISSAAIGSVHYISPEQARGNYSDARTDIYSLGITMYEMVTGRVPFEGDNTVAVVLAHLEDPVTPPSVYNRNIPASLEKIILKCVEKKPEHRYGSANAVISDLRKALVSPEEDFVKMAPAADASHTVVISQPELAQIREGRRSQQDHRDENRPRQEKGTAVEGGRREEYAPPDYEEEILPAKSKRKRREAGDDINPKIERLITAAGIGMAVIIVAVVLVILAKLGGLFQSKSPKDTTAATEAATEETATIGDKQVPMPEVVGLTEDIARAKLKEDALDMKIAGYEFSDTYEKGYIMGQEVEEGTVVNKYSAVGVTVSKGPEHPELDLSVMGLSGMEAEAAKNLLTDKGLVVALEQQNSDSVVKGLVIGVSPEKAKSGEKVTLYVSDGPAVTAAQVTMPSISGQTEEIAAEMLSDVGLAPGNAVTQFSDTVPEGTVIDQSITAGTLVSAGTAVDYVVSAGPEHRDYKYLASIDTSYPLQNIIGPGSGTTELTVKVQLKQNVEGKYEYRDLIGPVKVTGDVVLPISIKNIEGAYGVTSGELEVVNVDNGKVLTSFPLTFIAVPQ